MTDFYPVHLTVFLFSVSISFITLNNFVRCSRYLNLTSGVSFRRRSELPLVFILHYSMVSKYKYIFMLLDFERNRVEEER